MAHPGHGVGQSEAERHQQQDHDEEGRHHPAQGALHPLLHAAPHEPPGQSGEQQVGQHRPEGITDVVVETGGQCRAVAVLQLARQGHARVPQGPAPHHAVETEDEQAAQQTHGADPAPARAHQFAKGPHHPAPGQAADQGLPHQYRYPQGKAEQQKDQQEGAATVGGRHIGELPDGAETDRGTCGGQDVTEPG